MKKLFLSIALFFAVQSSADIVVYTDQSAELLEPVRSEFEKRTGIVVDFITESSTKELINRVAAEGESTFADLIYVKDLVYLNSLTQIGAFKPFITTFPQMWVDEHMRHPGRLWTGVTYRPRTLVYSKILYPNGPNVKTYSDLADPKWSGKLCLRTSTSSYNKALVSSFIVNMGYESAKKMLEGFISNLAGGVVRPKDSAVLESIKNGECELGLTNSYYLARKINEDPDYPVGLLFLNQDTTGVHINGSGIGVSKFTRNEYEANLFITELLKVSTQLHISGAKPDYPVRKELLPDTFIKDWGVFNFDQTNWSVIGESLGDANTLIEEVGYL